jgi:two-component system, NarL family, sensor histidine kinase BarA
VSVDLTSPPVVDIAFGDIARLEDVVDREALAQVCRSFYGLFGLSIRVLSHEGTLLADVHEERHICRYVNTLYAGRSACTATVGAVKDIDPVDGTVLHPCFTGARYRVVPITYQGRRVGRFVVGPYLPAEIREVPRSLLTIDPGIDQNEARTHLAQMPRVRAETAERITAHLRGIVDLLLFSSHRAHLMSEMHVASVRESYRELAENTSKLQAAYDRLKELDRLKSNFLATVSHELRTPLTSIIGYSEMLEAGIAGELEGEQLEFVQTIHQKGDHLLLLITSLLDLGKLEQGTMRLRPEPIHPEALLREVASNIAPQALKKNVKVELRCARDLPDLAGDPVRIRQVLFNLADNAVKFTPKDGSVVLAADPAEMEAANGGGIGAVLMEMPKRAIAFSISDTGIGMPPDEIPKIFDAFYQVDGSSTREHGGAGLGLSIVKRLVDAHGGEIRVTSEVGRGTTFTVVLPETEDRQ